MLRLTLIARAQRVTRLTPGDGCVRSEVTEPLKLVPEGGIRLLVHDVPLLVESGRWLHRVERVLVVDCEHRTQVMRVMARSALEEATVRRIIASQASRVDRRRAADFVLFNENLSMKQLDVAVGSIAHIMGL